MTRLRWMALCFALGSTCFFVGPFPGYVDLVGPGADAATFFAGSILFTPAARCRRGLAAPGPARKGAGRAAWWAAVVQSAGTLFFNVTTYQALHVPRRPEYDRLVWRPDAFGSVCFLVSGAIAYAPRRGAARARSAAAPGGGRRSSTCSAACSSPSRPSPGTSSPRPARCCTSRPRTGTPRSAPRASSPARWPRCAAGERRRLPLRPGLRELEHLLERDLRR